MNSKSEGDGLYVSQVADGLYVYQVARRKMKM